MRELFALALACVVATVPVAAQDTLRHPDGRYVDIRGHRVWVEIEGRGAPIVLIGGGPGGSHDYFHPWFSPIADAATVVYYDGFGRGKASKAADRTAYRFEDDVAELEALRQSLGYDRWTVLGHSYGGFVAQAYALQYPDRVGKLILANTFASPGVEWQESTDHMNRELSVFFPERWRRVAELRRAGRTSLDSALAAEYSADFPAVLGMFYFYDPAKASALVWAPHTFNPDVYYGMAGDDADFVIGGTIRPLDFAPRLRELRMPVLVLGGRADGIVSPKYVVRFGELMPGAQSRIFERSGHWPFIEESAEFVTTLRAFLDRDVQR